MIYEMWFVNVCLVLTVLFWVLSAATTIYFKMLKNRQNNLAAARLAEELGLTMNEDLTMTGELEGVPIEVSPAKVHFRSAGGKKSFMPMHRVSLHRGSGEEWFICGRSHRDRYVEPELPDIDHQIETGKPGFDKEYLIALRLLEPSAPFWNDLLLLQNVMDLSLEVVIAKDDVLTAWYQKFEGTARSGGYGGRSRLKHAIYATLAMTSEEQAMRVRNHLEEAVPPRPSLPIATRIFLMAFCGGLAGYELLDHEDSWMGFVVGFACAWPPAFALFSALRLFQRRRAEGRKKDEGQVGPYR